MWRPFAARVHPGNRWQRITTPLRRIRAGLRWLAQSQRFANLIGLVALIVAMLPLLREDQRVVADSPAPPPPSASGTDAPATRSYPATIVNTFSDEQGRFTGVQSAVSPYLRGQAGVGYLEGEQVGVACQVPDGRQVTDEVSGRTLSSRTWYRTAENVWIPAIYADLPGAGPETPPHC